MPAKSTIEGAGLGAIPRETLICGDALKSLAQLAPASVDLVLCDPPYGTTRCAWDAVIELAAMWRELHRVCRPGASIVFTAAQPFTSTLIGSNLAGFRYCLVWEKNRPTGFLNARRQPLRSHEDVVVFSAPGAARTYNPQGLQPCNIRALPRRRQGSVYGSTDVEPPARTSTGFPRSVLRFDVPPNPRGRLHPTQKPVELFEYLARTFSHPGETVLDFTMGSGTTGVACRRSGRRFVGIEIDRKYYRAARARIAGAGLADDDRGRPGVGRRVRQRRESAGDRPSV